jgi:hypothetical protein
LGTATTSVPFSIDNVLILFHLLSFFIFSLKVFKIIFENFIERGKITKSFPKTFPLLFPGWGLPGLGFPEAVEWRSYAAGMPRRPSRLPWNFARKIESLSHPLRMEMRKKSRTTLSRTSTYFTSFQGVKGFREEV